MGHFELTYLINEAQFSLLIFTVPLCKARQTVRFLLPCNMYNDHFYKLQKYSFFKLNTFGFYGEYV